MNGVSVVVRGGCMDVQWCFQNFPQGGDMSVDQGRGEVNYCERGVITPLIAILLSQLESIAQTQNWDDMHSVCHFCMH